MNRDKLSTLGLSATQVENALYNAYGTRQVSQIYAPNNQYQVILRRATVPARSAGDVAALHPCEQRPADSTRSVAHEDRGRAVPGESPVSFRP